jgi:hypothetical protein
MQTSWSRVEGVEGVEIKNDGVLSSLGKAYFVVRPKNVVDLLNPGGSVIQGLLKHGTLPFPSLAKATHAVAYY